MAEYNLKNEATVLGKHGIQALAMESFPVATLMTNELSIEKTTDREVWVTGEMTYTVTVKNTSSVAYTDAVLTDKLDAKITLVANSVTINDDLAVEGTDYTFIDGELKVNLPEIIAKTGEAIVVFRVSKVQS